MADPPSRLSNPVRLRALDAAMLADTPPEEVFDRLGQLARTVLAAPVSLVTVVDDRRQFFKSCLGLAEPWASQRATPLSHSFCRLVVEAETPLIVGDAREDPRVAGNPAIEELGVVAYAGMPLHDPAGEVLGSFCVIDHEPRDWSGPELNALAQLTEVAEEVVRLRRSALRTQDWQQERFEAETRLRGEAHAAQRAAGRQAANLDDLSHRLQRGLTPHDLDGPVGERVTLAYRAGSRRLMLGGDFVDVALRYDGTLDFVIGDVCGQGPEAAALAVALRASWGALQVARLPLEELMGRLNDVALREQSSAGQFATALAGRFAPDGRLLEAVSAGHPHPTTVDGDPQEIELPAGYPLGILPDARWYAGRHHLEGESILLYTDGLVDGRRAPGATARLGVDGLLDAIRGLVVTPVEPRHLPAALIASAAQAHGAALPDDVAILHVWPFAARR